MRRLAGTTPFTTCDHFTACEVTRVLQSSPPAADTKKICLSQTDGFFALPLREGETCWVRPDQGSLAQPTPPDTQRLIPNKEVLFWIAIRLAGRLRTWGLKISSIPAPSVCIESALPVLQPAVFWIVPGQWSPPTPPTPTGLHPNLAFLPSNHGHARYFFGGLETHHHAHSI